MSSPISAKLKTKLAKLYGQYKDLFIAIKNFRGT